MTLKKTVLPLLLGAALFCQGQSPDAAELRRTRILHSTRLTKPLPVDGNIQTGGWEKLSWSGNFVKLGSLWYETDRPTIVALAHDEKYLYIGMRLDTPHVDTLKDREKFDVWRNDAAELFLWTHGKISECLHFAADCTGKIFLAKDTDIPEMPGHFKTVILPTAGIKRAVKITEKGWQLTAAIPLKALGNFFGEKAMVNFGRQHRSPYGFDSWMRGEGYRNVRGVISFDPAQQQDSEKRYTAALKKFAAEREKIIRSFKKQVYPHKYAFSAGKNVPGYRLLLRKYSKETGYGWLSTEGIKSSSLEKFLEKRPQYRKKFKKQTMGPLGDTYIYADSPVRNAKVTHTFRIDLPDGEYRIHILSGIIENELNPFRRTFTVRAGNSPAREFENGHHLFLSHTFPAQARNGKLELTFEGDAALMDDPADLPLAAGDRRKYYTPGWLINAISVAPVAERKTWARQIAADELEIHAIEPEELGKYREVKFNDPEPESLPVPLSKRGFALWQRELGVQLYPESRPQKDELIGKLEISGAPGEFIAPSFGLLPLRDMDDVRITVKNLPFLRLEESTYVTRFLGGGDYARLPLFNDKYENTCHDMDKGFNRWFWLTGKIPVNAKLNGEINGALEISVKGSLTTLPVKIKIHPFRLVRNDFVFGGYNPTGYGRPGWARESRLLETCARYNLHAHTFNVDSNQGETQWKNLKKRLAFYRKYALTGPYVIGCYLPHNVDQNLRSRRIDRIPDKAVEQALRDVARIRELQKSFSVALPVQFMDEAHCKGDPYWSEQVRLYGIIKEKFPDVLTAATESDRSIKRVAKYLDMPIVFEVEDYNFYKGFKIPAFYTNQYLLEKNDMNSGRFQTGMIPAFTHMKVLIPWMLYSANGESGFRNDIWNMLQQRGVGGMHFMPKLAVLMGTVGMEDLAYITTLRAAISEALKSKVPARMAAAKEAQNALDAIREGMKPTVGYYYANGFWKSEVFNQLRKIIIEHILTLKKLEK